MANLTKLLESMLGTWEGECRTWFEPDQLADESKIRGTISPLLGGRFVRHAYTSEIQGKPRAGEETIAFNKVRGVYQVVWVDDFHMSYALLFSEGAPGEDRLDVFGKYDVGDGHPPWGWRTVFALQGEDQLTITAYNVMPDAVEAKAVETIYRRV